MQLCVHLGQGKSWVSAFHPQAGSPTGPPKHTPIRCVPNPTSAVSTGRHGKTAHTCIQSLLIDRGFGICDSPSASKGRLHISTHSTLAATYRRAGCKTF